MASSAPLNISRRLMSSSTGLCPRPTMRGSPIYSARLFSSCHLLYPGGSNGCVWMSLHRSQEPSPPPQRLGIRMYRAFRFQRGSVNEATFQVRFVLRPDGLLAPHRPGRLRSSFHLSSHLDTGVEYHYAGRQPVPAAGLTPARRAALWAANGAPEQRRSVPSQRSPEGLCCGLGPAGRAGRSAGAGMGRDPDKQTAHISRRLVVRISAHPAA
jgi:hypothetical protein